MKKIDWKRPVETENGVRVKVVRPGVVKGIPADLNVGRKAGENMEWSYSDIGSGGVSFLPNIRNVEGM